MKIHDLLILHLIKPDESGKPTGSIVKMVGTRKMKYQIDEPQAIVEKMTPDIVVTKINEFRGNQTVIIELETDVDFDFGQSLRQMHKYKRISPDILVIIPKEFAEFASLYKSQGIRVWQWDGIRQWQCMECETITGKRGPIPPKCEECNRKNNRLVDITDLTFEEIL